MKERKKVAIYTTFYEYSSSYSLTSVVHDQLVALVKHGYEPVLFVLDTFHDHDKVPRGVEVRAVTPHIILEPYQGRQFPTDYQKDVALIVASLEDNAEDIEVMICHDICFIDTYLPYNLGLRQARIDCDFLHWIHSAPSPRPVIQDNPHAARYNLPPRSKLVYLNHDKVIDLAEMYGAWPKDVRVIPNSRDPRTFWNLDPLVEKMIDTYDLFSCDIISVYPLSTTRMIDGKQLDVAIKIHEHLRQLGYTTKLIVPNAHANGEREKAEVAKWSSPHVLFTSLEGEEYERGVSSKIVSDFFRLSNVFIFPSISENCSLVLLEAQLAGNLLVLNKDCSGLQEFGGLDAIYFKMGNLSMGTRNEELALKNEQYFHDIALIIRSEFERNQPLQSKRRMLKEFNYDVMFKRIESVMYERNENTREVSE